MRINLLGLFMCLMMFLGACNGGTDLDDLELESQARSAVTKFHEFLNLGEYEQAADLYGGSYDVLLGYNPSLSEDDTMDMLKAACEFNGFMCLGILRAELMEGNDGDEIVFKVKFANPDGSEFVLGPCCGASEEEIPPVSTFMVHVQCEDDGTCLVMDLPPYVP